VKNRIALLTMPERSSRGNRPPQSLIAHPCVDFRGGDLAVAQRLLNQVQVPRLAIQPGRERVPQRVDRERPGNARVGQPPGEVELDLPL